MFTSGPAPGYNDTSWQKIQYNIPASALNKSGVKVRFGYQMMSQFGFIESSWNVDDVRILPGAVPNFCL